MAKLTYTNENAKRHYGVQSGLEDAIRATALEVYGPNAKVEIYSGGQLKPFRDPTTGKMTSTRHNIDKEKKGGAADVKIHVDGKQMRGEDLARFGQQWGLKYGGGIGLEMASGGIHVDFKKGNWNYKSYTPEQRDLIGKGLYGRDYRVKPGKKYVSSDGYAVNYDEKTGKYTVDRSEVVGPVDGQMPFGPMLYTDESRARALASGAGYDGLRNPVEIPTANDFRAPAPGLSTPRVTPAPTFTQGDRVVTNAPNMVGGGVNSMLGAIGNFASNVYNKAKDATPTPPQGVPASPLDRLRSMNISRNPFDTQQGAKAPVSPVQRSPLAAPQSAQPARTDALSRLRSMAEPSGDMRATPMDTRYARENQAMQAQFDRNPLRVTGGQQASQPAKKAATPRETVRALGRATAEPGFITSDMARRTPVSVPSSPVAQPAKTAAVSQPAFRSLGPATPPKSAPPSPTRQTAPASVASGTGSVLGSIGGRMMAGLGSTIAGLSAAPATPSIKTQQAAQVDAEKAATKPAYSAQTARAARPPGNFSQPPRAGLSSLGSTLSGLSKLPAADPNKINQAAVTNALTGTLSGALTGGIPGAIAGGLWGYATTPAMANQMNSPTLADPNAFGLGSLGSMFSGGGSGRDSTGASFSRGTYSDGPGRGLSYGASASRSGTRSGPTAGRQAGGSK